MSNSLHAAIEIGSGKIICAVAERDAHGELYVIGHGLAPSDGLKRGVVVDMDKTVRAIKRAIQDAQLTSGTIVERVTLGLSGDHIRSLNSNGAIVVGRGDREITRDDVARVNASAKAITIPSDREVVHLIPQRYAVDDQQGILDPIGMTGSRLEVETHIVTTSLTSARNLYRAFERCSVGIDRLVVQGVAIGATISKTHDRTGNCVIVDIGADLTEVIMLVDGAIQATSSLPIGGRDITNDLAIGLRISPDHAEEIKIAYGAAHESVGDLQEQVSAASSSTVGRESTRGDVIAIVQARLEEIFSLVAREIKRELGPVRINGGILLAGGTAQLPGIETLVEELFDLPVRTVEIDSFAHVPDELGTLRGVAMLSLLHYAMTHPPDLAGKRGARNIMTKVETWIGRYF